MKLIHESKSHSAQIKGPCPIEALKHKRPPN
jgi:hypothetical protein